MPEVDDWVPNSWRPADWPLIILVTGFAVIALSSYFICALVIEPFATYKRSIAAAAIKRPDFQRPLTPIEAAGPPLSVVTFRRPREFTAKALKERDFDIWVALTSEISKACAGAANPVRKIQQVLGLPPAAAKDNVMTEFEVSRDGLIRPCVAGGAIDAARCDIDFPKPKAAAADAEKPKDDAEKLKDYAEKLKDHERLRLVTEQMWNSYRTGFAANAHKPGDYPYTGFPFTGMGWSYDWSPKSPDHFGVSEFVIKRDAPIKIVSEKKPADFCGKPAS